MTAVRRTVYLARHGQTPWNEAGRWQGHTDIALDEVGRAQARALAATLAGRGITRVHTSDLIRARETAEIVAAALRVDELHVDAGLRERCFGIFEGLTRDECAARHPDEWTRYRADRRHAPPGAEAQEALVARMVTAVQRLAPQGAAAAAPALVVSHGGSIRALLAMAGYAAPPIENAALFKVVVTAYGIEEPGPADG